MAEIREWVSLTTGRAFKHPTVTLAAHTIKALLKPDQCCRVPYDTTPSLMGCAGIICEDCVYFNSDAANPNAIAEAEFLEFYREIWNPLTYRKREILYRVVEKTADEVSVLITYQPYIGDGFAKRGSIFRRLASGLFRHSGSSPIPRYVEYSNGEFCFLMLSYGRKNNETPLLIPLDKFYQFAFDVYLYNKTEGGYKEIGG